MKYAELRRQVREAKQRAAREEDQRRAAFSIVLGLARKRECGHRVIAHMDWPCPHPECSPMPYRRIVISPTLDYSPGPVAWEADTVQLVLTKECIVHNGETMWCWRTR